MENVKFRDRWEIFPTLLEVQFLQKYSAVGRLGWPESWVSFDVPHGCQIGSTERKKKKKDQQLTKSSLVFPLAQIERLNIQGFPQRKLMETGQLKTVSNSETLPVTTPVSSFYRRVNRGQGKGTVTSPKEGGRFRV